MSIRDDFFAAKAKGSLWDVAVSIKRGNPLPLDADSIFESYAALEAYAADVLAYPGQLVAVVNADSTGIYYLDQNLAIQPVGVIPSGDSKTIEVTSAGAISLIGSADAENGTLPMIENGALIWKTLEDIGAGDGNDNTTYEFDFANEKITVTPKFNGIAQEVIELDLSNFITTEELAEELGKLVDNDTTYSVAEGEKVLKLTDTVFSTEISLKHENGKISLTGIGGEVIAEFSDADFVKDSVLEDVEYNAESKEIVFTWKTVDGETKTDAVSVADFVQVYTAGNGLELNSNEFAVKVDNESEPFLTVGANGIKLAGVQDAIDTAAGTAKDEAIADAATKYATTGALSELETAHNERLVNLEAIDHTLLATKAELEPVATAAANAETAVGNLETRFDEIVAVGGEPNAINKIQVNGSELAITNKTVNIEVPTALSGLEGWTTLDERVAAAKAQADAGVNAASAAQATADNNTTEIGKHDTRISGLETAKNEQAGQIAALQQADATHAGEYSALSEIVTNHSTLIAQKADQTVVDGVLAKASANEAAITTLNDTTIPALSTEIGKKANAADVYTKTEVGTIAEGKTLVEMINEAKSDASYDDTEVRGLITDNANAIKAIYVAGSEGAAATGVLADEITRVEGLLTTEKTRAEAAEAGLDSRLDKVELFWETAYEDGEDVNVINTLREIQDYIKSDETGASVMASSIQANKQAIEAIYLPSEGETPAQGLLVTEVARVESLINTNTQAIAAINHSETGILATAKKYTNDQIATLSSNGPIAGALLGLVKSSDADNKIKVEADGTMSVNRISVDKLFVADGDEFILSGGNAS